MYPVSSPWLTPISQINCIKTVLCKNALKGNLVNKQADYFCYWKQYQPSTQEEEGIGIAGSGDGIG